MMVFYKDLYFRIIASLLAAHFVVMYGVEISFFEVLLKPMYWIALSGSFIIAFILMSFVRTVNIRLDRKYDWEQKRLERIFLQLFVGLIVPGIFAFLMAFIYFSIRGKNIFDTLYLRIDYPVILLLLAILNVYYFTYYMVVRLNHTKDSISEITALEENAVGRRPLLVSQGAKTIPIPVDAIAYFFREGNYNFLRTLDGSDHPITQALDEIEQLVSSADFFRANRQMLVSRIACKHFESLPHNKLELFTVPLYKGQIVISQLRSRSFRDWLVDG